MPLFYCKNKKLLMIIGVLLLIAILAEVYVEAAPAPLAIVGSDYADAIFSATCIVAVLGNALLSILFGASSKPILGVPFHDVLHHSTLGSEQRFTIVAMISSIVFSIPAYVWAWVNILTVLLIADVFLLLSSSLLLWECLSDEEMQNKIVTEIIGCVPSSKYSVYIDNWFRDLGEALVPNNQGEISKYYNLFRLASLVSKDKRCSIDKTIIRHIPKFFETASKELGFTEAYALLIEIEGILPEADIDTDKIAFDYLKNLKYKDSVSAYYQNTSEVAESIIESTGMSNSLKEDFTYRYISSIIDNPYLSAETKKDLMAPLMRYLCNLRSDKNCEVKKTILLKIVKHDVILSEDSSCRGVLFQLLTESLQRNTHYNADEAFISIVSEVFRAFYLFIYHETGTLTEKYRNDLFSLYHYIPDDKNVVALSFNALVIKHREEVIKWLIKDAAVFNRNKNAFWDYFSPAMNCKRIVWSYEKVTQFAFCFYRLNDYIHIDKPYVQVLESNEFSDDEKISLCHEVLELFSSTGLHPVAVEMIDQIRRLIQFGNKESLYYEQEHQYFQDKLIALQKKQQSELNCRRISNSEIRAMIRSQHFSKGVFCFDDSAPLYPGKRVRILGRFVEKDRFYPRNTINEIARQLRKILNNIISSQLRCVHVDFGANGISTLLAELQSGAYCYRNYVYVNDYGIKAIDRSSDEYKQLCEVVEKIPFDMSMCLDAKAFMKSDKIPFNCLVQYEMIKPKESAYAEFVKSLQQEDGRYLISTHHLDYDHALEYAQENYEFECVDVFICATIDEETGFQLKFIRNK